MEERTLEFTADLLSRGRFRSKEVRGWFTPSTPRHRGVTATTQLRGAGTNQLHQASPCGEQLLQPLLKGILTLLLSFYHPSQAILKDLKCKRFANGMAMVLC